MPESIHLFISPTGLRLFLFSLKPGLASLLAISSAQKAPVFLLSPFKAEILIRNGFFRRFRTAIEENITANPLLKEIIIAKRFAIAGYEQ